MVHRSKIHFFLGLTLALIVFFSGRSVSAHSGTGPPYLKINDQFAQTNPLASFAVHPLSGVSLDSAPDVYSVGIPITFLIDQTQLGLSDKDFATFTFRWTWEAGSMQHEEGPVVRHAYEQIGSHLVTLEAKGNDGSDFVVIDSVQVDIVPTRSYERPGVQIAVVGKEGDVFRSGNPIHFRTQVTTNASATIQSQQWVFTENETSTDMAPTFTFLESDFTEFVTVRVTDSNGFWGFGVVQVNGSGNNISFIRQPENQEGARFISDGTPTPSTQRNWRWAWWIGGGIVLIEIVRQILFRRGRRP